MGKTIIIKTVMVLLISIPVLAQTPKYVANAPWEPDSILVAWLIKRHVAIDARFESVPKGTEIDQTYSINTSDSPLRRSARFTAFEMAQLYFKVQDECIEKLRPIIRIVEMTPWRKHEKMNAMHFEAGLMPLMPVEAGVHDLSPAFEYIDNFCKKEDK